MPGFSAQLGQEVKLVYLPDTGQRLVSARKSVNQERVSFADGSQHLIIGQASLDYLNAQLAQPVPMNRFRPNLVYTGGQAHEEDSWRKIEIGGTVFYGVGACIRCQVPNIDQDTGIPHKEPNRTLARYRQKRSPDLFWDEPGPRGEYGDSRGDGGDGSGTDGGRYLKTKWRRVKTPPPSRKSTKYFPLFNRQAGKAFSGSYDIDSGGKFSGSPFLHLF